jgi:MscS family membrane protein
MNFTDLIDQIPDGLYQIIARVGVIILVILLVIILRRVLTWLILRPLRRLAKRSGFETDDHIVDVLVSPMRLFIIALALAISVQVITTTDGINNFVFGLSRSFIIASILLFIYNLVDLLAPSSLRIASITGFTVQDRLLPFLRVAVKTFILAVGGVILLQEWGYDVSGLLAGIGIGGLALSLAAQDTLANLFGFVAIVSDRPFDVGEFIKTGDTEGTVEHVGLRSIRVRQQNQAVVYIPNNMVANSPLLNWSRLKKRFLDLRIGVEYETTNDQLRLMIARIRDLLVSDEVVEASSVVVNVIDFRTESIDMVIRAYIFKADWKLFTIEKERLTMTMLDIMKELKIELADTITDIRMVTEDRPSRLGRTLPEDIFDEK